jgi:hypothetical protein
MRRLWGKLTEQRRHKSLSYPSPSTLRLEALRFESAPVSPMTLAIANSVGDIALHWRCIPAALIVS